MSETPDAKSKRMAKEVPERIRTTREASAPVYDVVKPAAEHAKSKPARKAPSK